MTKSTALTLDKTLQTLGDFLSQYVVFANPYQRTATTLWVAITWAVHAFDVAPYLLITAPERRSGKTRLLEVLELVVHKPLLASNISPAALYRVVHQEHPTLLLDEIDAIYGPKAQGNEELRALINAGHRRGVVAIRMKGPKSNTYDKFDPFCPKALAGIDDGRHLPDTIVDRSITIRLQRRAPDEEVVRYRRRTADQDAEPIRTDLRTLLEDYTQNGEWPELPGGLSDRATDVWEPLLAMADYAGGDWPNLARDAANNIHGIPDPTDDSFGIRLLSDIRQVMDTDRIHTSTLIGRLIELDEAPWGDLYGKPITTRKLADVLRPYGITSTTVRNADGIAKGYKVDDFLNVWHRYLPPDDGPPIIPYRQGALDLDEDGAPF